ncbi:netrin receptor UNC5B-a-like isoform X2 [Ptychodera flava]|uniref:netrin receptor UNC5B-a-like isoform X2 n=1 Tax=Ptychodera flava TaxID=63121 RepID=UPI00396A94DF
MERTTATQATQVQDLATTTSIPADKQLVLSLVSGMTLCIGVIFVVSMYLIIFAVKNRRKTDHKRVHSGMPACIYSPLRTKCKNTPDFAKIVSMDTCDIAPEEKDKSWTANIEHGQFTSEKRTIDSKYARNTISSGTPTTTERNDKTEKCVNLGTVTNVVVQDTIVSHIDENTQMENDESFLTTRHSITTHIRKDTKTDGYTTCLADENSKCSTSDTARELCIGPIQHDDNKENMILPVQVNEKFKEAIFDHNGGHLTLENYGISLFVPPGAIENGVSQAVSIELSYDKEHMPHLLAGEAVISPVVICRPKGLIFKESVILSYPHCGSGQHKIKHLVSDTDHSEPVYYRDSSNDKDSISLVMGGMCLRVIDHFTLYASVAEGLVTKAFMIFADLRNKDGITLRIWIMNNTEDALKEVTNNHEFRKKGTELFGPKPYTIDSTSGDVQIEFKGVVDGWSTPNTLKVPLKRLLEHPIDHEQIIISRKECLSAQSDIVSMMVCAYQLQNSNAESVNMPIYIDVSQGSQAKMERRSNYGTCTGTTEPLPAALPLGLCQRICLHMDPTLESGSDWRRLAEEIGLEMPDIQLLEENKVGKSPTGKLLNIWQSKRKGVEIKYFQELRYLFHKIERYDVARYISKFIGVFEKDGLEAADQAIAPSSESQMVLAEIEYNDMKKHVMHAQGDGQWEENVTQSRCQPYSNDKLSDDDDESPEEFWTDKSCHQVQSQDSFTEEKLALISQKDGDNEKNVTGLCRDSEVASEESNLLRSDSGYYSKSEVNGNEHES